MRHIALFGFFFARLCLAQDIALPVVRSIELRGSNAPVNFATQVGRPYDRGTIEKDVRQLWSLGRFDDIRAETAPDSDGIAVIFNVVEPAKLRLHKVRIEPSTFGLRLTLPEGTRIDRLRAHEIATEARKQLNAQGYTDARVEDKVVPLGDNEVDLLLTVKTSGAVRVKEIDFAGGPALDPKELRAALRALRIRRLFPGMPGLWDGWRLLPAYGVEAVDADLARLRSLYLSKGYFDSNVHLRDVEIRGTNAYISILVEAGRHYDVRGETVPALCSCLFAGRRQSEREGILDYSATLDVRRSDNVSGSDPIANVSPAITTGRRYRAGRIDFAGNYHHGETMLRRSFLLDEGDIFDRQLLRKSIARLNRTMLFEPLDDRSVAIHPHESTGLADVSIRLTERKRGTWNISGPAGPMSFAGPLQASLSARMPSWGAGLFELSTYTASISLLAFARPVPPFVSFAMKRRIVPVLALERPYSPAEGWKSGFMLAPQIGWRVSGLSYMRTQLEQRLLSWFAVDNGLTPDLPVTIKRAAGETVMFCEPPKGRSALLRSAAGRAMQIAGMLFPVQ